MNFVKDDFVWIKVHVPTSGDLHSCILIKSVMVFFLIVFVLFFFLNQSLKVMLAGRESRGSSSVLSSIAFLL